MQQTVKYKYAQKPFNRKVWHAKQNGIDPLFRKHEIDFQALPHLIEALCRSNPEQCMPMTGMVHQQKLV